MFTQKAEDLGETSVGLSEAWLEGCCSLKQHPGSRDMFPCDFIRAEGEAEVQGAEVDQDVGFARVELLGLFKKIGALAEFPLALEHCR